MKRHEVRCPNCQEKNRLDRSQIQFNCTACGKKFRLQRKADQSLKPDLISDVLGKPYTQRKQSRAMAASSNAKIEDSAKSELSPQARHYLQTQDRKKILTPDQKIEQYTSGISAGIETRHEGNACSHCCHVFQVSGSFFRPWFHQFQAKLFALVDTGNAVGHPFWFGGIY